MQAYKAYFRIKDTYVVKLTKEGGPGELMLRGCKGCSQTKLLETLHKEVSDHFLQEGALENEQSSVA